MTVRKVAVVPLGPLREAEVSDTRSETIDVALALRGIRSVKAVTPTIAHGVEQGITRLAVWIAWSTFAITGLRGGEEGQGRNVALLTTHIGSQQTMYKTGPDE